MTQLNLLNLKNVFLYEIGLIAIREVSSPFDEEQRYWRPYQPKHSPSYKMFIPQNMMNLYKLSILVITDTHFPIGIQVT